MSELLADQCHNLLCLIGQPFDGIWRQWGRDLLIAWCSVGLRLLKRFDSIRAGICVALYRLLLGDTRRKVWQTIDQPSHLVRCSHGLIGLRAGRAPTLIPLRSDRIITVAGKQNIIVNREHGLVSFQL